MGEGEREIKRGERNWNRGMGTRERERDRELLIPVANIETKSSPSPSPTTVPRHSSGKEVFILDHFPFSLGISDFLYIF